MIEIKHLRKKYARGKEVISDLNLSFDEVGLNIIVGKSGCGKTTLINILGGMDRDYEGIVSVDGHDLNELNYTGIADYRNFTSAFVFQKNSLFEFLTVEDNLKLCLDIQNNEANISEALERVGLAGFEKKKVKALSGGEKQRVAIARALIKDCKIIFADEPTSAIVNGRSIFKENKNKLFGYRNSYVGLIFQDYNLIEDMNVYDNIKLPLELLGRTDFSIIDEIIKKVDIEDIKNSSVKEISSGQMQRVAIARALVKNSTMILADEPTGNLDSKNTKIVMNLLKEISKERLVIVITHDDVSTLYKLKRVYILKGFLSFLMTIMIISIFIV